MAVAAGKGCYEGAIVNLLTSPVCTPCTAGSLVPTSYVAEPRRRIDNGDRDVPMAPPPSVASAVSGRKRSQRDVAPNLSSNRFSALADDDESDDDSHCSDSKMLDPTYGLPHDICDIIRSLGEVTNGTIVAESIVQSVPIEDREKEWFSFKQLVDSHSDTLSRLDPFSAAHMTLRLAAEAFFDRKETTVTAPAPRYNRHRRSSLRIRHSSKARNHLQLDSTGDSPEVSPSRASEAPTRTDKHSFGGLRPGFLSHPRGTATSHAHPTASLPPSRPQVAFGGVPTARPEKDPTGTCQARD